MQTILERLKVREPIVIKKSSPEKIELMPINELKFSKKRVRQKINREEISLMAKNLKTFGILQPLEINEKNEVVLGARRFEAAKLASIDKVPCIRRTSSEIYEIEKQLVSDLHSKHLTVLERALAFKRLIEMKNITKYFLAKYLNLSHNLVCRTLAILECNQRTYKLMKEGKISQRMAAMILYRLKDKSLEDFVVNEAVGRNMGVVQVENFVSEINDPEIFKKHFLQRVKAFKTTLKHFREKLKLLNLTEKQKREIIEELRGIDFKEIF